MHIKGRVSEINREPRELGCVLCGYGMGTSKLLLPYASLSQLKYSNIHQTLHRNYHFTLSKTSHLPS